VLDFRRFFGSGFVLGLCRFLARSFCRLLFDQHLLDQLRQQHDESQKPNHEQDADSDTEEAVC